MGTHNNNSKYIDWERRDGGGREGWEKERGREMRREDEKDEGENIRLM